MSDGKRMMRAKIVSRELARPGAQSADDSKVNAEETGAVCGPEWNGGTLSAPAVQYGATLGAECRAATQAARKLPQWWNGADVPVRRHGCVGECNQ